MQINNLKITHRFTHKVLVENLNFIVNKEDKIAIIGEEGNGKSTILKAIYYKELDYAIIEGSIMNDSKLGYLPQSMDPLWLSFTVEDFFLKENPSDDINFDKFNDLAIVQKELGKMNLNIDLDRIIGTLSGGEKIKIQLIKLLILNPDILLLDEPTNDLDLGTIEWLEEYIEKLDKPVIYISHDETLLENTANKIVHIEQLKKKNEPKHTVRKIDYATYRDLRIKALNNQEQVALNERREHKKQMDRFREIYQKVEHKQATISRGAPAKARLLAKKIKALKSQEKRFDDQEFTDIPVVEEAINIEFPDDCYIPNGRDVINIKLNELKIDDKVLSENVELTVTGNEKVVITGNNGTGKTTLLKLLLKDMKDKSLNVGYFPQNYEEVLDFNLSGLDWLEKVTKMKEHIIRAYMGAFRFTREEMVKKVDEYSGGQRAKLCILNLILNGNNVLVLDEPTRNFSPLSNPALREALIEYPGCIVSISHDRKFIKEVADKVYQLTKEGLHNK